VEKKQEVAVVTPAEEKAKIDQIPQAIKVS